MAHNNSIYVFQEFHLDAMVETQNSIVRVNQGIQAGLRGQKLDDTIKVIRTGLHADLISIFLPLKNEGQPQEIKDFFKDVDFNSIHEKILEYFDKEVAALPRN